jgi:hypothetical protein
MRTVPKSAVKRRYFLSQTDLMEYFPSRNGTVCKTILQLFQRARVCIDTGEKMTAFTPDAAR